MTVIVLAAVTAGLRGELTRWFLEIAPGVFVGRVSGRVRERVWAYVCEQCAEGNGLLVCAARNEQGFMMMTVGSSRREPVSFDGVTLIRRVSRDRAV